MKAFVFKRGKYSYIGVRDQKGRIKTYMRKTDNLSNNLAIAKANKLYNQNKTLRANLKRDQMVNVDAYTVLVGEKSFIKKAKRKGKFSVRGFFSDGEEYGLSDVEIPKFRVGKRVVRAKKNQGIIRILVSVKFRGIDRITASSRSGSRSEINALRQDAYEKLGAKTSAILLNETDSDEGISMLDGEKIREEIIFYESRSHT